MEKAHLLWKGQLSFPGLGVLSSRARCQMQENGGKRGDHGTGKGSGGKPPEGPISLLLTPLWPGRKALLPPSCVAMDKAFNLSKLKCPRA